MSQENVSAAEGLPDSESLAAADAASPPLEVNQANVEGMIRLANALRTGDMSLEKDPGAAAQLYRQAAECGDVSGMNNLGWMLANGAEGVEANAVEAAALYRQAVELGNTTAMNNLAWMLANGAKGVEANAVEAAALYRQAAERGDAMAMKNLGVMLERGPEGVEVNAVEAAALYRQAAERGNATAMNHLAWMLEKGAEGIEPNAVEAAALYRQAAESGNAWAMFNLGAMLEKGAEGVEPNAVEAAALYRQAAERENAAAMNRLGWMLETGAKGVEVNAVEAAALYRRAAERGNATAMANFGVMLENGAKGIEPNPAEAAALYRLAAGCGNATAMNNLAWMLANGAEGVEANVVEAAALYRRAAERGDATAINNLGVMLENGAEGVEPNAVEAAALYCQAAERGNATAMSHLAWVLEKGTKGVEPNPAEAAALYRQAAERGNALAMNNLGVMLLDGAEGVKPNAVEAAALYRQAAERGNAWAMNSLGVMLERGAEGGEVNAVEAAALYRQAAELGNAIAMHDLAWMLEKGAKGVEADAVEAAALYRQAAGCGNAMTMTNLAWMLQGGAEGVEVNAVEAAALYRQATERGNATAMNNLGVILQKGAEGVESNVVEAAALYRQAADRGNVLALTNLAWMLEKGAEGVEANAAEAAALYRLAAEHGDVSAMSYLGRILEKGAGGVESNVEEAAALYRQAAEHGSAGASFNLCRMLENGAEIPVINETETAKLFNQAAKLGNPRAINRMEYSRSRGKVSHEDFVQEFEDFKLSVGGDIFRMSPKRIQGLTAWASALTSENIGSLWNPILAKELLENVLRRNRNDACALHELAVLYENGVDGVPKDEERAMALFSRASEPFVDVSYFDGGAPKIIRVGMSKPKTCLLVTLGGGARGKTATVNSLRRMPFVARHLPTEMAALNKCVVEPGARRRREEDIAEMAHRETSLRVNASRFDISLPVGGIASQCDAVSGKAQQQIGQCGQSNHGDVIERVRRSVLYDTFSKAANEGSLLEIWDMAGQSEYEMAHSMVIGGARVLVFVTDLERVERPTTRRNEVKELCYWMQLAHMVVREVESTRAVIVGTRKGGCSSEVLRTLKRSLVEQLDERVYNAWVRTRGGGGSVDNVPRIVAIENSESEKDIDSSGLGELERAVKAAASEVLAARKSVPLRWLAIIDKLEREHGRESRMFFCREEVREVSSGFPGYVHDKIERERDVLEGLRCFASMGNLVLWERGTEEWYVFMDVEKIVHLVGRTTAPEEKLQERLDRNDLFLLRRGWISRGGLFRLWEGYKEEEKQVLLELLCEFDMLMILEEDDEGGATIGIPALMPYGSEGLEWGRGREKDVEVVTEFDHAMPHGLIGGFMACMHRVLKARGGLNPFAEVRANAALLKVDDGSRVFIGFEAAERKLRWKCRGLAPMKVVRRCLRGLEGYLKTPIRNVRVAVKHVVLLDCGSGGRECQAGKTVELELSGGWVCGEQGEATAGMPIMPAFCKSCHTPVRDPWRALVVTDEAMHANKRQRMEPEDVTQKRKYDVFISHAGTDKQTVAVPLYRHLRRQGVHTFLDIEKLQINSATAPEMMRQALAEARIGIFVLSPEFAARRWPLIEVRTFLEREKRCVDEGKTQERPVLLPVFLRLNLPECRGATEKIYGAGSEYADVLKKENFYDAWRQRECNTETAATALTQLTTHSGVEVRRACCGEELSSAAVVEETVRRICDFLREEGQL